MISVVIPTCNRSEYLLSSVLSVIEQSVQPFEVVIVNNGTQEIDKKIQICSPLVKVVNIMPFAGVSQARNIGVIISSGKYIAFLDDDDLWGTDYIKKISLYIQETNFDLLVARVDQLKAGEIVSFKSSANFPLIEDAFKFNPGYVGSSLIVKKSSFLKAGGFDVTLITSEDKSLFISMSLLSMKVVHASDMQTILRQHDGERLTNSFTMLKGIESFYLKWSDKMTLSAKLCNKCKFYRYKWLVSKNPLYFILYFILRQLYKFS